MRLVRSQSVEADALTGFKKSQRAKRVIEGLLPPPVSLGGKAAAYLEHELVAVIAARATDDDVREVVKKMVADRTKKQAS